MFSTQQVSKGILRNSNETFLLTASVRCCDFATTKAPRIWLFYLVLDSNFKIKYENEYGRRQYRAKTELLLFLFPCGVENGLWGGRDPRAAGGRFLAYVLETGVTLVGDDTFSMTGASGSFLMFTIGVGKTYQTRESNCLDYYMSSIHVGNRKQDYLLGRILRTIRRLSRGWLASLKSDNVKNLTSQ